MKIKMFVLLFSVFFICTNCFGGDLEKHFEQMLKEQKECATRKEFSKASERWLEQKIKERTEIKVVSLKKVNLPSFDKNSYYVVSWCYSNNPKIIYTNLYELSDDKLVEQTSVWIQATKTGIKSVDTDSDYIFDVMDYAIPLFLHKPNFHSNYYDSKFYFQCEANRIENTLTYIKDFDGDGNDEIFSFCWMGGAGGGGGDYHTGIFIYKYVNQKWKKVLYAPFFGWKYFFDDENYKKEEWYQPKPFPYDFVEYKGKVGLRIVCYDSPRERPSHYHAQFWAYNEETQEYEMLEEIQASIERTSADGLIFADSPGFMPVPGAKFSMLGSKLSAADLKSMDKAQLRLLRNAVYAHHGSAFAIADNDNGEAENEIEQLLSKSDALENDTKKLEEIIYTSTDMQLFSNKEKFELKLLEKGRFLLPGYFLVLGVWLYKEINEIFMYYFVIRNEKVEKRFGLNDPLKISEIGEENFLKTRLVMQVLEFQVLDFIAFQYDFNHDGNDEILMLTQNNITGSIHFKVYVIDIYSDDIKKALDISEFPGFSVYPEFVNYKFRQGLKVYFTDSDEWRFYYYDRLQQKYVQDKNATSEELEQIHGSPDFFAEAGIDYTKLMRPLVPADLEGFSKPALRIWRNAVYARHGRKFASEDLQALFNEYVWYKPDEEYSDEKLSAIDRANIKLIQEFEER